MGKWREAQKHIIFRFYSTILRSHSYDDKVLSAVLRYEASKNNDYYWIAIL